MPIINIQNKSKKINKSTRSQFFFLPGTYCESLFQFQLVLKNIVLVAKIKFLKYELEKLLQKG